MGMMGLEIMISKNQHANIITNIIIFILYPGPCLSDAKLKHYFRIMWKIKKDQIDQMHCYV